MAARLPKVSALRLSVGGLSLPRGWLHALAVAGTVAVGVAISLLLYRMDRDSERRRVQVELDQRAHERVELLREKITRSTEVLHAIASLFEARTDVSRAEFDAFVASALARQPELLALSWTPRVGRSDRERYEQSAQADGFAGFRFVEGSDASHYQPVADRPYYLPVYYISPMPPNGIALGFDLNSHPARAHALDAACRLGSAVATPPIKLVQETRDQLGFIVFYPIYNLRGLASEDERQRAIASYTGAVYRINDLVGSAFRDLDAGIAVTVEDRTDSASVLFARGNESATSAESRSTESHAGFELAGRRWAVLLRPTDQMLASRQSARPVVLASVGLAMTLLLSAYMSTLLRQRSIVERQVHHRTAALTAEVAERQRAEQNAIAAELKYKSIFDNCIEGIFQTTADGHYLSVNPALTRMYGYESPDELIRTLSDISSQLYVDPKRRARFVEQMRATGLVSRFESEVYRRDGSVIWISENARAVHDSSGTLLYYEGIVEDITEQKTADDRLRAAYAELDERVRQRTLDLARSNAELQQEVRVRQRAELAAAAASRAKSVFLANVSHEIRTPMNAITGYAQLLKRDPSLPERHREAVETIVTGADHLLNLIEELLDLSRAEAGESELRTVGFELHALVDDVVALFRQSCANKAIAIETDLPEPGPLNLSGDEGKLRQVLINLIGNAVKFTDAGSVRLTITRADVDAYHFSIADTGIGIPDDLLGRIFEPFSRVHPTSAREGSGLGLAIAKRHVGLMGGELAVTSVCGQGSTFSFTIPLAKHEAAGDRRARHVVAILPRPVRAMVIDDVAANRDVLRSMLRSIGCEVLTAESGRAGIEAMHDSDIEIVFLDVLMPEMDGVATAAALRVRSGPIRVVGVSALAPGDDRVLAAGFDAYLVKPIRMEELHAAIVRLLAIPVAADPEIETVVESAPGKIEIPESLLNQLIAAAEIGSVTDLKAGIHRLEAIGPDAAPLANRLRTLLRTFDMENVSALLASQSNTESETGQRLVGVTST